MTSTTDCVATFYFGPLIAISRCINIDSGRLELVAVFDDERIAILPLSGAVD